MQLANIINGVWKNCKFAGINSKQNSPITMDATQTQRVRFQKALFSKDLPFSPSLHHYLYIETSENEKINTYINSL